MIGMEVKKKTGEQIYNELKSLGLNNKQINFVTEYMICLDPTKAYQKVYGSYKNMTHRSATAKASMMLSNVNILSAIQKLYDKWLKEKKLNLEKQIIDTYYKRAFYNISMFQKEDGSFIPLDEIPDDWKICIDGTEVKYYGKDADVRVVVLKLPNREKALEQLGKWINLISEKVDVNIGVSNETKTNLQNLFAQIESNLDETERVLN